jgi:hypothetical protein
MNVRYQGVYIARYQSAYTGRWQQDRGPQLLLMRERISFDE